MLDRIFSLLRVNRKLIMGKNATMVVTSTAGVETTLDMAELAALNGISATELGFIDGVTAGTAQASKALVVDANKDIISLRNVGATNYDAGASGTAGSVDVFPVTAAKGKLAVTCTDQTGDTTVSLVAGAMAAARTITIPDPGAAASVLMTTGTATAASVDTAELNYLDITTLGTGAASKAVVLDAGEDFTWPATGILTYGVLKDPAATTIVATGAEINRVADASTRVVSIAVDTAITELLHDSKILKMGGAGVARTFTLPAATGSGGKYLFVVGAVNTSNYLIKSVAGADTMDGQIMTRSSSDTAVEAVQSWQPAATDDTITLNATTTGGVSIGDWVELIDIATNQWMVRGMTTSSGTEATPFSDTVA